MGPEHSGPLFSEGCPWRKIVLQCLSFGGFFPTILTKAVNNLKIRTKITAVIVLLISTMLLCSCGIKNVKMIDGETFVSRAEDMGFAVTDLMTEDYEDDYYALYEATSDEIYIQYFYAKDDNMAIHLYNNDYADVTEKLTDSDITDESASYMYARLTVNVAEDGRYIVVVRSGGTYMYIECTAQARVTVDKFLENIGY